MQLTKYFIRLSLLILPALFVTVMSLYSLFPSDEGNSERAQVATPTLLVKEPSIARASPGVTPELALAPVESVVEPTQVSVATEFERGTLFSSAFP